MDSSISGDAGETPEARSGSGESPALPWHAFDDSQVINVAMIGAHARVYQRWLATNGLYLFQMPGMEDGAWYGVGVESL